MPVLSKYDGCYCLAYRGDTKKLGCSLYVRNGMPRPVSFQQYEQEWGQQFESLHGITFYPEIRYKGMRVWPLAWHRESKEPILKVHTAWTSRDYPPGDERAFDEMLKSEGWVFDHEGGQGYVHVDDLEKIEGPPPEGAF